MAPRKKRPKTNMYIAILVVAVLLSVLLFMLNSDTGTEIFNRIFGGESVPEGLEVFQTTQDTGELPPSLPTDIPGIP